MQMLIDYPQREYPPEEELDPKTKKPKAPPKKKKKAPPFPLPDWAEELSEVQKKVKEMQDLASQKENLQLDDEFLEQVKEQMVKFKKEIEYRKDLEEQLRLEEELKALKRAKKKK